MTTKAKERLEGVIKHAQNINVSRETHLKKTSRDLKDI